MTMSTYDYRTQLVELNGVASVDIHVGYFASPTCTLLFFCIVERFCSVFPQRNYEVARLDLEEPAAGV